MDTAQATLAKRKSTFHFRNAKPRAEYVHHTAPKKRSCAGPLGATVRARVRQAPPLWAGSEVPLLAFLGCGPCDKCLGTSSTIATTGPTDQLGDGMHACQRAKQPQFNGCNITTEAEARSVWLATVLHLGSAARAANCQGRDKGVQQTGFHAALLATLEALLQLEMQRTTVQTVRSTRRSLGSGWRYLCRCRIAPQDKAWR
mmetsp:Transcript_113075/g.259083  ORF Transcript_113075/g.259083 Transcript_113075/m.259083 type:complete len:201 (-) Transcript_113075:1312-1914(-)